MTSGSVGEPDVLPHPEFEFGAFTGAFDAERRSRGLTWYAFADELWDQSAT